MTDVTERARGLVFAGTLSMTGRKVIVDFDTREDAEAMFAALEGLALTPSQASEDAWQPIETAPKDGTVVVVYRGGMAWDRSLGKVRDFVERCELGWFENGRWWEAGTAHDMFEPWREDTDTLPTHWRPLPPPPVGVKEIKENSGEQDRRM